MLRRLTCCILCLLLLASAALADFDSIPTRETFSLAYDRLQTARYRGRPVNWTLKVEPSQIGGYADTSLDVISAALSGLELTGLTQCFGDDGGLMELSLLSDGQTISTIGQTIMDGRMGLNLTGEWISFDAEAEAEAMEMLDLDDFARNLLAYDYASVRAGDIPFLSAIYDQGITLWALASPYSQDSNRLSVPSGSTGHGVTYEIDTQGLRSMLDQWVDGLTMDGLSLGIPGTELSYGVKADEFDAFVQKARNFADTIELAKPIKFSTTFGEGDILRTAKGSGTLREDGKQTGISYSYTCSLNSTRITRKFSIDFQPRTADTLVLSCTWLTSSNNKTSGAQEITIDARGTYDGQPYRIKVNYAMVNKYAVLDSGELEEIITGDITASIKYADKTVADIKVYREGHTLSSTGMTSAVNITETFDATVTNDEGIVFQGLITLGYDAPGGPQEDSTVLADAQRLEDIDFMALEGIRNSMKDVVGTITQRLISTLPVGALNALLRSK